MQPTRYLAALTLVLLATLMAPASAAPKAEKPAAVRGLSVIHKALEAVTDLSDQQKTDTNAILADAEAQLVALRENAKSEGKQGDEAARKELRQKAQEIITSARNQVVSQLSDTQKKAFREAYKAAREDAASKRAEKGKAESKAGKKDQI